MHKIIHYKRYDPPDLAESTHKVNVIKEGKNEVGGKVRETVAEGVTLQHVYDNYIEPGKILRLASTIPRIDAPPDRPSLEKRRTAERYRDYVIFDALSTGTQVDAGSKKAARAKGNRNEIRHMLGLREVKILLQTPMPHFAQMMDKAYQFLQLGSPVEFDICIRHVMDKKVANIFTDSTPAESLDYVYRHFPHLRHDFIFKSMPEGTRWVVDPFSNDRHVRFVLGRETKREENVKSNFTQRLLNVQKAVMKGIEEGRIQQLPMGVQSGKALPISSKGCSSPLGPLRHKRRGLDRMFAADDDYETAQDDVQEAKPQRPERTELSENDRLFDAEVRKAVHEAEERIRTRSMPAGVSISPLELVSEATRKRLLEDHWDRPEVRRAGQDRGQGAMGKGRMAEGARRSPLHDVQEATGARLEGEDSGGEAARWAPGSVDDIPEEKRHLWEAWTAGGKDNVSRYYVPSKKEASKPVKKGMKRFMRSTRQDR